MIATCESSEGMRYLAGLFGLRPYATTSRGGQSRQTGGMTRFGYTPESRRSTGAIRFAIGFRLQNSEVRVTIRPNQAENPPANRDVNDLLSAVRGVETNPAPELLERAYKELRALAASYFRAQRPDHTLQPTALVHEAFVKITTGRPSTWESQAHFVSVAAMAMRQILIDHARARQADKRGGGAARESLTGIAGSELVVIDPLEFEDRLTRLAAVDERQARVVELRFFLGLSIPEAARVLGVSDKTVEMDWRFARAWLRRELGGTRP